MNPIPALPTRIRLPLASCLAIGLGLGLGLALPTRATAGTIQASAFPNALVPDANDSGLVSIIDIPATLERIQDVDITLTLVGDLGDGWNGDLFIYLAHGSALSVLVNRPGVSASNPFGYGNSGLDAVTFDDDAPLGDFHTYQVSLGTGDSDQPVTGTFQPDGRTTDPASVDTADPRSAFLSLFDGQVAAGEWRLFVADLSPGGNLRLAGWELNITTVDPVPDAGSTLALTGLGSLAVAAAAAARHRRQRARP